MLVTAHLKILCMMITMMVVVVVVALRQYMRYTDSSEYIHVYK